MPSKKGLPDIPSQRINDKVNTLVGSDTYSLLYGQFPHGFGPNEVADASSSALQTINKLDLKVRHLERELKQAHRASENKCKEKDEIIVRSNHRNHELTAENRELKQALSASEKKYKDLVAKKAAAGMAASQSRKRKQEELAGGEEGQSNARSNAQKARGPTFLPF
ncbi:hypothetical protein M8818_003094 [Zalaria obscura]|uniref:Uncharacterized protein n=1 Tax=Zalaria obscura TaxID=2024903 RepID=A0ACC3SFW1_9PEZI